MVIRAFAALILLTGQARGFAGPTARYALILQDDAPGIPPAAAARRANLRSLLANRNIAVTGTAQTLLNAVFVAAPPERLPELRALPGVAAVALMPRLTRKLNKALGLVNASAAWSAAGGAANAGTGVKIAILDTGIDETHPGFQDPSLPMPPGFPKTGGPGDAAHATNKIIAVHSLVSQLALGDGTPESTRPDDFSARDRVGHGTALAMIAAGAAHLSPIGPISGAAPKAWLGNYKIFGSPGVNDFTTADVVLQALELAFNDGMDIALVAAGNLSAEWSPADQGAACGLPPGTPCDPWTAAVAKAALGGMTVIVPAGNDGDFGWSTINTPGDSPAVITVGAAANSHTIAATVTTAAGGRFPARSGDGPQMSGALSAPLRAVSSLDASEHGCFPYAAGALSGTIALVGDGQCSYATKVLNAQAAGALAVLIFTALDGPAPLPPAGLSSSGIPAALISLGTGLALKSYLKGNPGAVIGFDPAAAETPAGDTAAVAHFSSRGPNNGDLGIKPDLAAPGVSIYTATQNYDPNGDLYSATRYAGVDGTSFAAAFAAGAAALVKQAHPAYGPVEIKSALANTASPGVTDTDENGNLVQARSLAIGGGRLDIGAAAASTLTADPVSLGFGALTGALPSRSFTITNTGAAAANVQLSVQPRDAGSSAAVSVSPAAFTLAAGQSAGVLASLRGSIPPPGLYEGVIAVAGGAVPVHIPYLFVVASGAPAKLIPLLGHNFVTEAGTAVNLAFRVVDAYGVPVPGKPVRFAPADSVYAATPATDGQGIAAAYLRTANSANDQSFSALVQGNTVSIQFEGRTRALPQIAQGGVVDAASLRAPSGGFAPGSYLTLFGAGLSESTVQTHTPALPVSLAGVSVSFDAPSAGVHVAGRLAFVSGSQVSVQVPWELAGVSSAVMKVTLNDSLSRNVRPENANLGTYQSQTVAIPIAAAAPAFFEYVEASGGKTLAAALDESGLLSGPANPVRRGHAVQFYLNGLGAVVSGTQPPSGEPAPGTAPLATTLATPVVTIGGQLSAVQFSGLAPFLIGLYQVNAIVPPGIGAGIQPVTLSIGAASSQPSALAVQ